MSVRRTGIFNQGASRLVGGLGLTAIGGTPPSLNGNIVAGNYPFAQYDSGVRPGDIILGVVRSGSSAGRTHTFNSSGLTFTDLTPGDAGTGVHVGVAVSPDSTPRVVNVNVGAGTTTSHRAALFILRGATEYGGSVIDTSGAGAIYTSATTPHSAGSLTTSNNNSLAVCVCGGWSTSSLAGVAGGLTYTAGWTEVTSTSAGTGWAIAMKPMPIAGSAGALTVTPSSSSYGGYHLFSVRSLLR